MAKRKKKSTKKTAHYKKIFLLLALICSVYLSVTHPELLSDANVASVEETDFSGDASVEVNGNKPTFTEDEIVDKSFERYGEQDSLGRFTAAVACVGQDIMPTEKRESIARIKPTGWVQNKYPGVVKSRPPYLYNRCHLIGFQLTGENDNDKNFVTGTRYLNVDGMLPYENMVASYVKESGNHVMYRVTPVFQGDNLLCDGVNIEALSVEDGGEGICFNVFCYNVQPGVVLNYADGTNWLEKDS